LASLVQPLSDIGQHMRIFGQRRKGVCKPTNMSTSEQSTLTPLLLVTVLLPRCRDHSIWSNLFAHCMCFVMQLVGNFSLLTLLAEAVPGCSRLPELSVVFWGAGLFAAEGCPPDVKLAALAAIGAGYRWGALFVPYWREAALAQAVLEAIGIANLVGQKKRAAAGGGGPHRLAILPGIAFLAVRLALYWLVFVGPGAGCLDSRAGVLAVYSFSAAWLTATSVKEKPIPTPGEKGLPFYCFTFGLFGWLLAGLSNQPILFWLGSGFLANIMQGVTHDVTGQQATVVNLQNNKGKVVPYDNTDQWAHVSFFPLLLFHSIRTSLLAV
jgi:hypothetical protein